MNTKTPETDKLIAVSDESQKIGEFLEWLADEKGWHLATYEEDDGANRLYPVAYSINHLLAEFYDIDLDVVDRERRALLDELRQ